MDEKIKELLYRSFDEALSPEDTKVLEQALANSDELVKEKEDIARLRNQISEGKILNFKPFFADRVLNRIQSSATDHSEEALFDSLFILFRPVAIAAAALIILVAGYNIVNSGNISLEGALAIPEVTLDEAYDISSAMALEEE
jgi:hypothetical protein